MSNQPLQPNQTVAYPQITAGISRRLDFDPMAAVQDAPAETAGGDLNGTAAQFFKGQVGTGMGANAMPRRPPFGGK